MTQPLRLGIAGLGTVGAGLISIIQQQGQLLAQRAFAASRSNNTLQTLQIF